MAKGINSPAPTTAEMVGGVYNVTPPTLQDGQAAALQLDVNGKLITSGAPAGVTNVNIANVSGSPTASNNPLFVELSDGTNPQGTDANPIRTSPSSGAAVQPDNVSQWGSIAVQAAQTTATDGTGAAPIVRATPRRFGQILTSTPLGASATFTSAWFDTNQTGDVYVQASCRTDQNASNPGLIIDQTDDTANGNFQAALVSAQVFANSTAVCGAVVTRRYWRVRMVNFTTPQGTLEVVASTSPSFPFVNANGAGGQNSLIVTQTFSQANIGDQGILLTLPIGFQAGTSFGAFHNYVVPLAYTGAVSAVIRMPAIFKTASVAATVTGNSAVWTPAAGKKFRLMCFQITAQGLAATATGVVTVSFQDNVTGITIGTYDIDVPAIAGVVSGVSNISCGWIDLGNGFLSAAANNVLNFNISAAGAGTVGTYRINVCGTEE